MKKLTQVLQNFPFKRKLFVSYLVMIILPVSVLGLYSYVQSKAYLQKQAMHNVSETAQKITVNLDNKIDKYNGIMDSIVYNVGIQKIFSNKYTNMVNLSYDLKSYFEPTITAVLGLNKEILQITVYTQNQMPEFGNYIYDSNRVSDQEWYQKAIHNMNTEWFYEHGNLLVARKFPDIFEVPSVVYIRLNKSILFKNILIAGSEEYEILIKDRNAQAIYDSSLPGQHLPNIERPLNQEFVKTRDFYVFTDVIPNSGWTIYFYIPRKLFDIDVTKIIKATAIIILICFSVLLALMWFFSNTLLKPIQKLNNKMKLVENGDLSMVVHSNANDEIGSITNRFGNMLKKINELIQEVYQNKITQQEAELKALQAQINPHFLYNTLSVIKWKSLQADQQEIFNIVSLLANFYRTALNNGNDMIPVQGEVVNIQSYIEIMAIRKDYKFKVSYHWDPEIFQYKMIPLILQPVVENAIVHGISKKTDGRGELTVKGIIKDQLLEFTVKDNGNGMSKEKAEMVLSQHSKGYGLKNVNDRLKIFFGHAYGISIESKLNEGTVMRIVFPMIKNNSQ